MPQGIVRFGDCVSTLALRREYLASGTECFATLTLASLSHDRSIAHGGRGFRYRRLRVTLRVSKDGQSVVEWELSREELSRFVARLLREEQRAAMRRPQAAQQMEVEREIVAETDAMGFTRPPVPDQAIVTMRFGGALLGFLLPLQTLGLTLDELYRRTRRAGPPEDPTRH